MNTDPSDLSDTAEWGALRLQSCAAHENSVIKHDSYSLSTR